MAAGDTALRMKRALAAGAWTALVLAAGAVPALAAPSLEGMFVALQDGAFAEARAIADQLQTPETPDFARFVDAAAAVAAGDCGNGQPLAESVVTARPDFLPAYDLIGVCMSKNGQARKAARMFRTIAQRLPEGEDRNQLLARAASLSSKTPFSVSFSGYAKPTTNINHGTDETKIGMFTISPAARRTAGVQVSGELRLDVPLHTSERMFSTVALIAGASHDSSSNSIVPLARFEVSNRWMFDATSSFGIAGYVEATVRDERLDKLQPGVRLDYARKLADNGDLALSADVALVEYPEADRRDGLAVRLAARVGRVVTPSDKLTFSLAGTYDDRRSAQESGIGAEAEIEWEHRFSNGLITSLTTGAGIKQLEALAPLTDERQLDYFATAGIAFSHESLMIGRIRPEIGYKFTNQWSNDLFSRYTAHDVTFRAKAQF